jgi:hypothetical protein
MKPVQSEVDALRAEAPPAALAKPAAGAAPGPVPQTASDLEPAITDDELHALLPELCEAVGGMITTRVGCTPLSSAETARMGRALAKLCHAFGITVTNPKVGAVLAVGFAFSMPVLARRSELDKIAAERMAAIEHAAAIEASRRAQAGEVPPPSAPIDPAAVLHRTPDQIGPLPAHLPKDGPAGQ